MGLRVLPVPPDVKERIKDNLESGCFELAEYGTTEEAEVVICPRCGHLGLYSLEPGMWYEHTIWYSKTTKLWECVGAIDLMH